MKLLAIMGSPRRGGNTDLLLDEFLRGFRDGGGETEKVCVGDLRVSPCLELMECEKTGDCPIEDDMGTLAGKIYSADSIVVASPIFFYGLPAQLKAVIDRGQAFWSQKHILKIEPKAEREAFALLIGATKGENLFEGSLLTLEYFFEPLGVRIAGKLLYRRIDRRGDIGKHPTALADAYRAGRDFAGGNAECDRSPKAAVDRNQI